MARPHASASIIAHVTSGLLVILRRALGGVLSASDVVAAPLETISTVGGARQRVLLYLYRVAESPHLKNQGPDYETLSDGRTQVRRDPLSLDLHYLLVPFGGAAAAVSTHELLGMSALAFHEHGIFTLSDLGVPTPGPPGEPLANDDGHIAFRLTKEPLSLTELAHIWEAVNQPYRLSLSYVVRTVQIRSGDVTETQRVIERRLRVEDMP